MNSKEKDVFTKSLAKMDKLHVEYIDKANEAYLKEEKEEFSKYQLAYQMVKKCIDIVTVEARLHGFPQEDDYKFNLSAKNQPHPGKR
jgi:hypothetical protein